MKRAVAHLLSSDPVMARVIGRVGVFRMRYRPPTFETLARSIVYQQLSGKAAATIYGRLSAAAGPAGVTPSTVARLSAEELRAAGLSAAKAAALHDLANHARRRRLRFDRLPDLPDEEVVRQLVQVRGVGVWTAQMFLMFGLRRRDVLPVQDLGIRTAVRREYELDQLPGPGELHQIAAPWRPFASVACWYLWRSLDGPAAL
jgi:DNA-3-methyladenine glycosylase II